MNIDPVENCNHLECIRCGQCKNACPVDTISCGIKKQRGAYQKSDKKRNSIHYKKKKQNIYYFCYFNNSSFLFVFLFNNNEIKQ